MIKPTVELTRDLKISTYSLVVGIAKKAREISADAETNGTILEEKPVDIAVQEYKAHDFKIIETEPCPVCGRLDCICEKAPAETIKTSELENDSESVIVE